MDWCVDQHPDQCAGVSISSLTSVLPALIQEALLQTSHDRFPVTSHTSHQIERVVGAFRKVFPKTIDKSFQDGVGRYWFMLMMHILRDENVQVSGMLFILDYANYPLKALTMYGPSETKELMKYQVCT